MTNVTPIRPTIGLSRIEQLRAFVAWEKEQNPDKVHIAEWALSELEELQAPIDYNDAMQILEDPKAAAWELRDLAKSLLEDLQVARAAERERCAKEAERQLEDEPYGHAKFRCANIAAEIRALGDQP